MSAWLCSWSKWWSKGDRAAHLSLQARGLYAELCSIGGQTDEIGILRKDGKKIELEHIAAWMLRGRRTGAQDYEVIGDALDELMVVGLVINNGLCYVLPELQRLVELSRIRAQAGASGGYTKKKEEEEQ